MELKLTRPLIFFDLETTGTNITTDRIVEISLIKVMPDGEEIVKARRINPGMHIPEEASKVHHIKDEDVSDCPTFSQIAKSLYELFEGCDLAGFNSNKFDIPLLIEEFGRAGIRFSLRDRRCIDVQNIYHKKEPRTLVAAYSYYCNKDLEEAHSAFADTKATYEVLKSQLDKYPDLENDVEALSRFSRQNNNIDIAGRIVLNDANEPVFNFGKHKGKPVKEVLRVEPSFFNWMMMGDFPRNTKDELARIKAEMEQEKKKN